MFALTSALSNLVLLDALKLLHTLLVENHANHLLTVISMATVLNVSTSSACLEEALFCQDATTLAQQIRIVLNSDTVTNASKICAMI